jgi:hypothetical protein
MSLNDAIEYEYDYDNENQENSYPSLGTENIVINDTNQGNYLNHWINFNSNGLTGKDSTNILMPALANLQIPYTIVLEATNCTFGACTAIDAGTHARTMADDPENAFAISWKSYLHLIDNFSLKLNSVQTNSANVPFASLLMHEKLKSMSDEKYRLYSEIINHAWDTDMSYIMNPTTATNTPYDATKNTGLEINNNTKIASGLAGFSYQNYANLGHIKRMRQTNHDITATDYMYKNLLSADKIANSLGTFYQGPSTDKKKLYFTGVATLPLALVSDFMANMPSVANLPGLDFKIQSNIGNSNSWTYNFKFTGGQFAVTDLAENKDITLQSVTATQPIGNICPFMISPVGHKANTGLSVFPDYNGGANPACSIKVTCKIGYDLGNANNNNSVPCSINIPSVNMNPVLSRKIYELSTPHKILFDDFQIEWMNNVKGGTKVERSFANQLVRPRKLYLFAFLSASNPAGLPVYQQLTSSAGNTITPIKLSNFSITKGLSPLFSDRLQTNYEFYNLNAMPLLSINGASLKSHFMSSQIGRSQWERIYGVYCFDIKNCFDEVQDNAVKQFNLKYNCDSKPELIYDIMALFTTQSELFVSRSTGLMTAPSDK